MKGVLRFYNSDSVGNHRGLDCGCGRGSYAHYALGSYVGLDINSGSLMIARTIHPNKDFVQGDARKLPFRDQVFDNIICSEVLEHIEDDSSVVSELGRVSEPHGSLILSVPNFLCRNFLVGLQRSVIDVEVGHVRGGYSLSALTDLISKWFRPSKVIYQCGPLTAAFEYIFIVAVRIFGKKPSNWDTLFGSNSRLLELALSAYRIIFPIIALLTSLENLLPKGHRSNIAILSEKVSK